MNPTPWALALLLAFAAAPAVAEGPEVPDVDVSCPPGWIGVPGVLCCPRPQLGQPMGCYAY